MDPETRRPPGALGGRPPANARLAPAGVPRRLLDEGYRYEFFQAVRLLERALHPSGGVGEGPTPDDEPIRFRPHTALAFPTSDVHSVTYDAASGRAEVTVTFRGLYGVDAPLPVYFHRDLAHLDDGDPSALRSFLDVFNHRLYGLLYRAWKKHRPYLAPAPSASPSHHGRLFERLAGLGTDGVVRPGGEPFGGLIAHAGRLAARARNAAGLEALISDALGGLPARVVENVPRRVRLREPLRLGRTGTPARLGTTALAGRHVLDRAGLFRLVLGPLPLHRYRALLPSGPQAHAFDGLVRLYAPDHLDYEVELRVRPRDAPPLRLGERRRLGRDCWVGRRLPDVASRVVRYASPTDATTLAPSAPAFA